MSEEIIVIEQQAIAEPGGKTALLIDVVIGGQLIRCHVPAAAIPNRMAAYGLATEAEAIEAILREHATRELQLPDHEHENPKIARMGGLRQDVTIRQGTEADLPPKPPKAPTPKERLAEAVQGATTLPQLKAALLDFAKGA